MKDNEYQCAMCEGVFEKGWSDEEAEQEAGDNFGKPRSEWLGGSAIVCEDCYQGIDPKNHPEELERAKKNI